MSRLLLTGLLLVFCAAGRAQPAAPRPARDSGPPLSTATDSELPDGDDIWAAAQETLAKAGSEPDTLRALVTVVNLQRRRGDYTAGLAGARDGLGRARTLGDVRLQVDFLYLLGRLYWNLTDYPHSLENHLEELKLAEQLADDSVLARTHGGLGLTYQRYGRNDDALRHFKLGLDFAAKAGDVRIRSSLMNSLGNYYLGLGSYDQAATMHEQALKLREGYGNRRAIAESLTNLGLIADARGDSVRAIDFLQRALTTFEAL
jgi:tetratricopeptide (TPR) repeat protein